MKPCIPKNLVEPLKQAALKGKINIEELTNMSSAQRREFFSGNSTEELGKFINTEFEKALVSTKKEALLNWAKMVFTPEAKSKPVYKSVLDKINALDEMGVLNPASEKAYLEDLVTEKLGIRVSPEEVKSISEKASKIRDAQEKLGNDLGNPEKTQENIDFLKSKKEMDDYLLGLNPASKLRVLTGTIGRAMMLSSVKSPILNIGSNTEVGITEALVRRLTSGKVVGADNKLVIDYVKMVNKVYQETGYDLSRMTSLKDTGGSGERVLGETVHSQGPGIERKIGRVAEDIVFKQMMGAPDVAFSSGNFGDSVNLNSMDMAKGDKVKAREIMKDSMLINPQTAEGEVLRAQAILDAQMATWTNTSWASKASEGIRKVLNTVSGDLRAGDYLLPFIKTPANVISTGMDYAGLGIPKAIFKTVDMMRKGSFEDKAEVQSAMRDIVRAGIGITGAVIIASQLKDDDFVGAYDPRREQIEQLRNSNTNSIRVGGKWISTDWLGPLMVPVTAIMYARQHGKTTSEKAFQYGRGVISAVGQIPGVRDVYDFSKRQTYKKDMTLEEASAESRDYLLSQVYSRLVPSILSDVAKASDKYDRQTGGTTVGTIKNKIPGLRQTLPIKRNVFGESIEGESAFSDIVFGSRIKTSKENDMIKELNYVSNSVDKPITFTDWDKSSNKSLEKFKNQVGKEKFEEAKLRYGQRLSDELSNLINSSRYKSLSDEKRLKEINDLDMDAMDYIFNEYGFEKKTMEEKIQSILDNRTQ